MPPERLGYTVKEAAAAIPLCEKMVRILIRRGELPARRIGKKIIIPKKNLENFLNRSHSTNQPEREAGSQKRGRAA